MSSSHFYRWNQFKVIPLDCTLRTRNLPQILYDVRRPFTSDTTRHVDGLSGRGLMTSEYGQNGDKPKRRKSKRRQRDMPKRRQTVNDVTARASSRIVYCGHSTQYSHLVRFEQILDIIHCVSQKSKKIIN